MPKNANADIVNRDFSTGHVSHEAALGTVARPCAAHADGQDNPQREYIVEGPKKGKLGGVGQAGN